MTGAAARDTVLIGATGAYAGANAASESAIRCIYRRDRGLGLRETRDLGQHVAGAPNGLADVDFRSI